MEISELYRIFKSCGRVSTDSRTVRGGELFFALKGEKFDGNKFASKALEAGAAYAVVSERLADDGRFILVDDTLETLKTLARYHREHILVDGKPMPVIGLTGTNGKTTTKELIRCVLAVKYRVSATVGNFNNDIGVPLTLLSIPQDCEIAVVEMGASHPDDIAHLVNVCEPDYGLITNVGKAHLLGFGSFEGVCKAKGQLYDYIKEHGRAVFVNVADPVLNDMASERGLPVIPYGTGAEVLPSDAAHPYLRLLVPDENGRRLLLQTQLVGSYNAANVLAAIAVGSHFGIPVAAATDAVAAYEPANKRSQMVKTARNTLIVDAYNANPTSMAAALDNFQNIDAPLKALLLGNMGELGEDSLKEHIALLRRLKAEYATSPPPVVFLVGSEFRRAIDTLGFSEPVAPTAKASTDEPDLRFFCFPTSDELATELSANPLTGYTILIKGSRSTQMEKVIPVL